MRMKLKQIREFFWPLLDPPLENQNLGVSITEVTIEDENIYTAYELSISYYKEEEDRKKAIESKSTIFIGTLGVTITIILGLAKLLSDSFSFNNGILLTALIIISLYLCRSLWFAIKALERKGYHRLSHNDFISLKEESYLRSLIVKIINYTNKNSVVINEKVDYMVMAQEYFKRAVVTVFICNFLVLLIYFSRFYTDINCFKKALIFLSSINTSFTLIDLLFFLVCLSYVLISILFVKIRKSKKY